MSNKIEFNKAEAKELLAGVTQLLVVIERDTPRWKQVTALGERLLKFVDPAEAAKPS